jgi:hypothetical protein
LPVLFDCLLMPTIKLKFKKGKSTQFISQGNYYVKSSLLQIDKPTYELYKLTRKKSISWKNNMPGYLQIILLVVVFIAFVGLILYMGGLAVQKTCLKIISEMEEARAYKEARAVEIQDERKNIFRVGTKNIRPKALNLLIADGLVIKTNNGKYYLDKEKLAQAKTQLNSKK